MSRRIFSSVALALALALCLGAIGSDASRLGFSLISRTEVGVGPSSLLLPDCR